MARTVSLPITLGIDRVALEPALDLLAHAAELDGHLRDVAFVLLEQRDELVAARVLRCGGRRCEFRRRDFLWQMRRLDLAAFGERRGALDGAYELADVARPRVREQRARGGGGERRVGR